MPLATSASEPWTKPPSTMEPAPAARPLSSTSAWTSGMASAVTLGPSSAKTMRSPMATGVAREAGSPSLSRTVTWMASEVAARLRRSSGSAASGWRSETYCSMLTAPVAGSSWRAKAAVSLVPIRPTTTVALTWTRVIALPSLVVTPASGSAPTTKA
jgi:hypothetical protein